ncbi:MAG: sulfite oxidase heme-binding subunit YedZ [Alcanivoracaceae bacterium]
MARQARFPARHGWLVWVAGLLPLAWVVWRGLSGDLGPDPAKALVSHLGWWGMVWLIVCLTVRPLVQMAGWPRLFPLRRWFGLLAFTWLSLHFLGWAWLLLGWDAGSIVSEIGKRPYILVGFSAWLLLLPLALTSTRTARRRLGRRWQVLHRLIYPAVLLGLLHDFWLQKSGYGEPLLFAAMIVLLLGWRWHHSRQRGGPVSAA